MVGQSSHYEKPMLNKEAAAFFLRVSGLKKLPSHIYQSPEDLEKKKAVPTSPAFGDDDSDFEDPEPDTDDDEHEEAELSDLN